MKHLFLYISIIGTVLLSSCENNDSIIENSEIRNLTFSVGVDDFAECGSTRSSYSVVTDGVNNAVFDINTSFEDGDCFGLYIVDTSGEIIKANIKCQRLGGEWSIKGSSINYSPGMASYGFYAYYPYHENISGGRTENSSVSTSISADDFFSGVISAWSPAADQSTKEFFGGSDLMVAKGSATMLTYQNITLSFTFSHKMGMVVTKKDRYLRNPDGTFVSDGTSTFTGNIPYPLSGWMLYIVKPNVTTSLGGHEYNLAAGEYLQDVANH